MTISYAVLLKNARLDQVETVVGTSALLQLYNGTAPANADAALAGNVLLANGALPSDWMTAASGGSKAKTGTWTLTGNASLPSPQAATFFRIYNSAGNVPSVQGTLGANVPLTTNANTPINTNTLFFAATTGVAVGQNVIGTNIPVNSTVLAVNAANIVMSIAANVALITPLSVVFGMDMSIDNNSIAANQSLSVSTFTLTSGN